MDKNNKLILDRKEMIGEGQPLLFNEMKWIVLKLLNEFILN